MATMKIYDATGVENSIEFGNNGENEPDQLIFSIDLEELTELYYFNLSKSDAKELIAYLRKEFKIP